MYIYLEIYLLYLLFVFIDVLKPYSWIYGIVVAILINSYSFFFMTKKVTKNITEYDYFELEKTYLELKELGVNPDFETMSEKDIEDIIK